MTTLFCVSVSLSFETVTSAPLFLYHFYVQQRGENGKCPVRSIPLFVGRHHRMNTFSPTRARLPFPGHLSLSLSHKATHNWGWGPQGGATQFVHNSLLTQERGFHIWRPHRRGRGFHKIPQSCGQIVHKFCWDRGKWVKKNGRHIWKPPMASFLRAVP